jgi:hypothetical protein
MTWINKQGYRVNLVTRVEYSLKDGVIDIPQEHLFSVELGQQ